MLPHGGESNGTDPTGAFADTLECSCGSVTVRGSVHVALHGLEEGLRHLDFCTTTGLGHNDQVGTGLSTFGFWKFWSSLPAKPAP